MTTIAWDRKTIAADRLAVSGIIRREVSKLYTSRRFVFGGVGDLADTIDVAAWLASGGDQADAPSLDEGGAHGIAIDRVTGAGFIVEGKRPHLSLVLEKFYAAGSGREFALAAMHLGKSAKEAVRIAARFDICTGGGYPLDVVRVAARVSTRARA